MNEKYHFLKNTVIGEDKFEGKSQEKIANVLVNILNDENFQIIGIDGSWGTGKSNLVEIVNKKLPNHNFFIYDVWGHQEDEQRRAILIELTESLSKEEIIKNNSTWKKKLQVLLSKKKSTTTVNQPYLSIGFILSLFSIIYVPLSNTLIGKQKFENFQKDWWMIVVITIPLIIIGLILIVKIIVQLYSGSKWESFKIAVQQTFQVYTNKQEKETKIETISEEEPSVQEFRNWMKEIDKDLGEKKLVLVFDNFDRLPKKHILSIWSSLHVFFSEEKYKNIKVIVPFDRDHIKNAFKEMDSSSDDYSNDYINKTFDLVYRVSPPILSSWKVFFKENWKKAFIQFNEVEYLRAEQAYEVLKVNITPREIIAFINEVVSLKLLQSNVPERYVAIFVLNKDLIIKDPLKSIVELSYLEGLKYLYSEDENYQKFITALTYQIDPESALEIAFHRKLKDSLVNKNFDDFNEISLTIVFDKILYSVLNEIEDLRNPLEVLNQLKEDAKISDISINQIWNDLYLKMKSFDDKQGKLFEYHKILLNKIGETNKQNWLELTVKNFSDNNVEINDFVKSIDNLNDFIIEHSIGIDIYKILPKKKIQVGEFVKLVEDKEKMYPIYNLECNHNEIDEYLSKLQLADLKNADFIEHYQMSKDLDHFKAWLQDLGPRHKSDLSQFEHIMRLLKHVSSDEYLPIFLDDAELYSLFTITSNTVDFYADLIIIKIKHGSQNDPSYQPVYDTAFQSINEDLSKKIIKNISFYMSLDEYLIQTITFNRQELNNITKKLIESELKLKLSDEKIILDQFQSICQTNLITAESLFIKLDDFEIEEFSYDYVITLNDFVFENAVQSKSEIARKILDVFKSHFDNSSLETWGNIYSNLECRELKLLQVISYSGWNAFALEAFKSNLLVMVTAGKIVNPEKVEFILRSIEDSDKDLTNTFKDIRDELISSRNINENIFTILFTWLEKYGALNDKSNDVLRTKIVPSLLDSDLSLDILIAKHSVIKNLKDLSDISAFSDFKDGIIARKGNPKVLELAKLLSITIPKDEKSNDVEIKK